MESSKNGWRWLIFVVFFVLFPIVFRPWWLAVVSIVVFTLFMIAFYPRNEKSK